MSDDLTPPHWGTTCGQCIQLSECAYEFGAKEDDPVCTGFREPLRVTLARFHTMREAEHDEG
jgi:hypothetical protein